MGTKNISIHEDVYRRLAEEKREGESFGGVIDRLMTGRPLMDFVGEWSDDTANHARDAIEEGRERSDAKLDRLYGDT